MVVGQVAVGASAAGAGERAVELVEYEESAVELGGDEEEGEGEVVGGKRSLMPHGRKSCGRQEKPYKNYIARTGSILVRSTVQI